MKACCLCLCLCGTAVPIFLACKPVGLRGPGGPPKGHHPMAHQPRLAIAAIHRSTHACADHIADAGAVAPLTRDSTSTGRCSTCHSYFSPGHREQHLQRGRRAGLHLKVSTSTGARQMDDAHPKIQQSKVREQCGMAGPGSMSECKEVGASSKEGQPNWTGPAASPSAPRPPKTPKTRMAPSSCCWSL